MSESDCLGRKKACEQGHADREPELDLESGSSSGAKSEKSRQENSEYADRKENSLLVNEISPDNWQVGIYLDYKKGGSQYRHGRVVRLPESLRLT